MKPLLFCLWIAVAIIVVTGVLLFTPLGARPLAALFPVGQLAKVDFKTLKLADKPNQFLICPPDYCASAPHADSPVFDIPDDRLRERWRELIARQPRVERLKEQDAGQQIDYLQRSARFRFPDIITVRFIPISSTETTLAIYSRSLYGESDFGVNRARIRSWLEMLRQSR